MLLLAEIYSLRNETTDDALEFYGKILDARTSHESTSDISRKMAPLYQKKHNYTEAINCLQSVLKDEHDPLLQVQLYTKIAGNYKQKEELEGSVEASRTAYEIMVRVQGEKDLQTCKTLLNFASTLQFFEQYEQAKEQYSKFTALYAQMDPATAALEAFVKLNKVALAQLEEIEEAMQEPAGDEYYD